MVYTTFDRAVAWLRFRAALPHIRLGARVCDIGCGLDARFLEWARPRIGSGVGVDYQVSMLAPPGVTVIRSDITVGLPFRTRLFDHVVMLAVLEHLPSPQLTLSEAFRVLVPGGSLIMTWPHPAVDSVLHWLHACHFVSAEMESDKHQPRIPLKGLKSMLREIGFEHFEDRRFEFGLNNLMVAHKPR